MRATVVRALVDIGFGDIVEGTSDPKHRKKAARIMRHPKFALSAGGLVVVNESPKELPVIERGGHINPLDDIFEFECF